MNRYLSPLIQLLVWCFPLAAIGVSSDTAAVEIDMAAEAPIDTLPPIDKMPKVIERVAPVYPPELARRGIEGTVLLDCVVSDSGTVDSVFVVKGVHPQLDSSAAVALWKFRFSPARSEDQGGRPRDYSDEEWRETLKKYKHLSNPKIAKIVGCHPSTVWRAKDRLKYK